MSSKDPEVRRWHNLKSSAKSRQKHARVCKLRLDDCDICKRAVEWYATLRPQDRQRLLEERR